MPKIVCLGAGSASFGLSTLITLLRSEGLRGSEIALVDINQQSLDLISRLANWLNSEWGCGKTITSFNHHQSALPEADFVVSAIEAQPRERLWQQDFELTLRHGLRQPYAENGGPGGFAHTARNVNAVLNIARDMEDLCPQAWFINFSNPMHRLCYLVNQYTKIRVVGLCHQIGAGYAMAARALAADYGIPDAGSLLSTHADPANHEPMQRLAKAGQEHFEIFAAGLNHFTWMLALRDRQSGEDLLPLFRQRWQAQEPTFEPLTRQVFDAFGLFPIPGDEHLCEYLPWVSSQRTQPWQHFDLSLYDWELHEKLRDRQWQEVESALDHQTDADLFSQPTSEGALELIESITLNKPLRWEALNIPNDGLIAGLPANSIVEVPGDVSAQGIRGLPAGQLPQGITGLLQREVVTSQLAVDAIVHGDRQLALQSLLLDPVIDDIATAQAILDDILLSNQNWLPQFWQ